MTAATDREETRDRLLIATLPHVTFDGWTAGALNAGAADAGMDEATVKRFFPGGAAEMVEHFSAWADARMADAMTRFETAGNETGGTGTGGTGTRARIALVVRLRFEALAPHREAVRRTIAWLALPVNGPLALRCLSRTVDAMWLAAGDQSVDFSFYTKRALLAGVLGATALYWLDDDSDGGADSWAFLERRLDDVLRIPALGARARRLVRALPDPFGILRAIRGGGR
jgi:ubiquinone biosynthesis protein COQ9